MLPRTGLAHFTISKMYRVLIHWASGNWQDRNALRRGFERHYTHVRSIVPKDNLLEFHPRDGWGPLCKFLGKPIMMLINFQARTRVISVLLTYPCLDSSGRPAT